LFVSYLDLLASLATLLSFVGLIFIVIFVSSFVSELVLLVGQSVHPPNLYTLWPLFLRLPTRLVRRWAPNNDDDNVSVNKMLLGCRCS